MKINMSGIFNRINVASSLNFKEILLFQIGYKIAYIIYSFMII